MTRRVQIQVIVAHPDAVRVDRATMWGNPFRSDRPDPAALKIAATAAEAFALWLDGHPDLAHVEPARRVAILKNLGLLHGKTLACWCPPESPCHADVLLRMARDATPTIGDALGRPEHVPRMALSVRQPWAWAIIHAGKDVENRTEASVRRGGMRALIGQRIAIHAAKGMTRDEYEGARDFIDTLAETRGTPRCPPARDLERGGIIGHAFLASVVKECRSPWFFGPRGLCLTDPEPVPFIGAMGELGMFSWSPNFAEPDRPARWMLPEAERPTRAPRETPTATPAPGLFDEERP